MLPKGYLQPGVRGSQTDKPAVAVQQEGTEVCSGALRAGRGEDLLQKAIVRTEGGQARQKEEGRARVFMAHSGNCESFGVAGFRRHIRALTLER